jgi:hypothetical protein
VQSSASDVNSVAQQAAKDRKEISNWLSLREDLGAFDCARRDRAKCWVETPCFRCTADR